MKKTLMEIDHAKLEHAITSRGLTLAYASTELGYHDNYLSQCKSRGTIGKAAAIGLTNRFGIPCEEYKKQDPVPEPEIVKVLESGGKDPDADGIDYGKLANVLAGVIDYQKLCATIISALKKVREEE